MSGACTMHGMDIDAWCEAFSSGYDQGTDDRCLGRPRTRPMAVAAHHVAEDPGLAGRLAGWDSVHTRTPDGIYDRPIYILADGDQEAPA